MGQTYQITHTVTGHTYKAGFKTKGAAFDWWKKNKTTLNKYLPADVNSGEFEIVEDL